MLNFIFAIVEISVWLNKRVKVKAEHKMVVFIRDSSAVLEVEDATSLCASDNGKFGRRRMLPLSQLLACRALRKRGKNENWIQ